MRRRAISVSAALAITMLSAAPALAHGAGQHFPPPPPGAYNAPMAGSWQQNGEDYGAQRDAWLAECRHRRGDNGVGGAVIGGLVGGIAGHEIAGRGNRALGTVAGAVVGAVAGAAIDKAEDRGRVRDSCDDMLAGYSSQGYNNSGYAGYGYTPMMVMVPVMMMAAPQAPQQPCKETVTTTEYVTYETVRRRMIPRRPVYRPAPDKRVKMVPDKRDMTH
ncbi:MAG: glycine zipper 2TM domain-containing protein [Novosphingobium sp.]